MLPGQLVISQALHCSFQVCLSVAFGFTAGCAERRAEPREAGASDSLDRRTPVVLTAEARQAVLLEMRQMLGALGGAMASAAREDTAALIAALVPAGSAAAADPALEALLPAGWKELAERTHGGFDDLVAVVRRTGSSGLKDTVLVALARVTGACTSCHETFRVTVR